MIRVSVCAAVLIVGVAVNQFLVLGESDLPALKNPKLIVTKSERKLEVFDGEELIKTYRIALGSSPVGDKEVKATARPRKAGSIFLQKTRKAAFIFLWA